MSPKDYMMTGYQPPVEDTLFLLHHVIDTGSVYGSPGYAHADLDTLNQVLRAAGDFASEELVALDLACESSPARLENRRVRLSPGFERAYEAFVEHGWPGLALNRTMGGSELPELAQTAVAEFINGACLPFGMVAVLGRAAARTLLASADSAMAEAYAADLVTGKATAAICMTEPQAGSDASLMRTRATPCNDGSYRITGTKIFISFGDHDLTNQIVHILLARLPDAREGSRGLSLFVVPKLLTEGAGADAARNKFSISRVEDKMGLHGSPTCVVDYDGATAYRISEEGRGVASIFTMVNTMRLDVAVQGVAISDAATQRAYRYAAGRAQGSDSAGASVVITEHPDVRRMLMIMSAFTEGGRAMTYEAAYQMDLSRAASTEDIRIKASKLLSWLLPVCKAGITDAAIQITNLGVQVHGGHGYIRETGAERYVRDARIMTIYEGTSGIQAIDLVTRKLARDGGYCYHLFRDRIEATLVLARGHSDVQAIHGAVTTALARLEESSKYLAGRLVDAPDDALAGATAYLTLAARTMLGWMWLRMAMALPDEDTAARKVALAQFTADYIMPECETLAQQVRAGAASLYAVDADHLAPS